MSWKLIGLAALASSTGLCAGYAWANHGGLIGLLVGSFITFGLLVVWVSSIPEDFQADIGGYPYDH